jgi:UDP-glucuronate decarboxylase
MKNIIITGGAGFIGKNIIKKIVNMETTKTIIILDNFITSDKIEFLSFIKKYDEKKILFLNCNICNHNILEIVMRELVDKNISSIDEIYHLASLASPPFYKKNPLETLDVGYIGTKNMLELAKIYSSKLLFTSTSEVYGDALISPQNENYYGNVNCFGERSSYDESKRVGEALCYTYINIYNIDVKIARIFNTYGPHMLLNDGRIITEVISNLINDTTLTIYGDGEQTRSCSYIDDTVLMLIDLMSTNTNTPVNIGNNQERTINETVEIIVKIWNELFDDDKKIKIQYKELTQNDPLQRQPCLKLNKEILGEINRTNFEDGIRETIKYFTQEN